MDGLYVEFEAAVLLTQDHTPSVMLSVTIPLSVTVLQCSLSYLIVFN